MASARALATASIFLLVVLSTSHIASSLRPGLGVCRASGYLPGKSGNCEKSNDPDCCEDGKRYPQYHCSPPVTATTKAVLTLNSFEKGKDGGGPSECDNAYHSDEMVVALHRRALGEHGSGEGELCVLCHACRSKAEAGAEAITKKQKRITVQHCSVAKMASARALATASIFLLVVLSTSHIASSLRPGLGVCRASGYLPGKSGNCEKSNDPDCCEDGKRYPQYHCSPPVTATTKAVLTLNSFEKGKDGGGPSECDNAYHSDEEMVVALSTGWFKNMARCGHRIRVTANGKSARQGGGRVRLAMAATITTTSLLVPTTSSTRLRRCGMP
ncbi:hypothetical protein ZWY2020_015370 [Hordeum vulgare]|nr:hypothetical protein ZWY2020_015370 [Hordeum vulgare]